MADSIQAKIIDLRARAAKGEVIPDDELREAIQHIRVSRTAAQTTTTAKKKASTPLSDQALEDLFK